MRETIPAGLAGERVDRVVALLTGLSRSQVAALVADGRVQIGGEVVTTRSTRVDEGDVLEVAVPEVTDRQLVPDPDVEVPVVWSDDHLLVVDKPAGLVVHPGAGHPDGTLVHGLLAHHPEIADVGQPERPGIVHRLDRGTSGLLLVARTPAAYDALVAQLAAREVDRRYDALVWGTVADSNGLIDAPIGRSSRDPTRMAVSSDGREARTRYEVVERFHDPVAVTRVQCALETGRTHQIRVHLTAIGHPVVGDVRYGGARQSLPLDRPFLHATRLELDHPITGERLRVESPLPPELRAVLDRLA